MTHDHLLNTIKIEIRSLLISSSQGLTDDELSRDYARFNSQSLIPYDRFGYLTLREFLNSLTDVLYRSSNDNLIYPIVNQSTEHIHKLVQEQHRTKKKKKTISSPSNQPAGAEKTTTIKLERISLTNEFLRHLLVHFRQQNSKFYY